jgi:hypothetical protein
MSTRRDSSSRELNSSFETGLVSFCAVARPRIEEATHKSVRPLRRNMSAGLRKGDSERVWHR